MKIQVISTVSKLLTATALLGFGTAAMADTTWYFNDNNASSQIDTQGDASPSCAAYSATKGNNVTCTPTIVGKGPNTNVNATAYATTGGANASSNLLATAQVTQWGGGFGVKNDVQSNVGGGADENEANSPNHAMDNFYDTDLLSLNFNGSAVVLNNIGVGWTNNGDADVSVLAWTGGGTPTPATNILGKTLNTAGLLAPGSGWTLVGHYDLSSSNNINSSGISSSWWLISAYNASYGDGTAGTRSADTLLTGNAALTGGNDYVKVLSVAGKSPSLTPEPGSMALFGAALLGFVATRRRKQVQQA